MFQRTNVQVNLVQTPPPEEEEPTCFQVVIRFLVRSLLFLTLAAALIYVLTGNTFLIFLQNKFEFGAGLVSGGGNAQQGTEGQQSGEEKSGTEGGATPTSTPAPPGDENTPTAPTPAVIFPTAAPSATPWVYPAPSQPAPTQPAPSPGESACPYVDGDTVWLEVRVDGVRPGCFSIASWQRIGLVSYVNDELAVVLGDNELLLPPGQSGLFSEPVSSLLSPGVNTMQVELYGTVEIWLVAR